ncbi:MAG: hypothetical protein ACAH83_20175 [Alphaproteobacteria bacterium]
MDGAVTFLKMGLTMAFAAVAALGVLTFPYRDPLGARNTLQNEAALKNVQIQEGRAWFSGCGRGYVFKTKFNAVNANGQPVKGVVCKDLWGSRNSVLYKK